jgi:hypothetical protein
MMDKIILEWYIMLMQHYLEFNTPNLVNVISATRGWNPLEINEEMTIHYGKKTYIIVRIEDED